ncbi:MAG: D-tyrosyl-tRNA(Tyr) deacylase [Bacteroidetes bacterium]|nr:D-tyrosyl-tRNA(Tyr) deacylase [Bacteroidota bacterium]
MIAVIQRVNEASVLTGGILFSKIKKGLLVFIGIHRSDTEEDSVILAKKIIDLRIFSDENNKMNLSVRDIGGEVLVISQFTLCTDNGKSGNRPSFILAELPERAEKLYNLHIEEMKLSYDKLKIKNGAFGENMQVTLCNDGPVTIILQRNSNS